MRLNKTLARRNTADKAQRQLVSAATRASILTSAFSEAGTDRNALMTGSGGRKADKDALASALSYTSFLSVNRAAAQKKGASPAGEGGRGGDPDTHLVNQPEHPARVRIVALGKAVEPECTRCRAAALVECGEKTRGARAACCHAGVHHQYDPCLSLIRWSRLAGFSRIMVDATQIKESCTAASPRPGR
jgi:hypothetical protein